MKHHFKISFPHENEAVRHDFVKVKGKCLKVFCYHVNKFTILLFNSIFRIIPEVSTVLYFVEISLREIIADFLASKFWNCFTFQSL